MAIAVHHDTQPETAMFYIAKMLKRELKVDYVALCGHAPHERCICGKPSPYLLYKAMHAMRVELGDCLFIGSSYNDVGMGQAAGIASCHFVIPDTAGFSDILRKAME